MDEDYARRDALATWASAVIDGTNEFPETDPFGGATGEERARLKRDAFALVYGYRVNFETWGETDEFDPIRWLFDPAYHGAVYVLGAILAGQAFGRHAWRRMLCATQ